MQKRVRLRFFTEAVLAVLAASSFLLTLIRADWVEEVFAYAPDRHDGSLEIVIAGLLLTAAVALTAFARVEWRRRTALTN